MKTLLSKSIFQALIVYIGVVYINCVESKNPSDSVLNVEIGDSTSFGNDTLVYQDSNISNPDTTITGEDTIIFVPDTTSQTVDPEFEIPSFVFVEGGAFVMGNNNLYAFSNQNPEHTVTVNSFYISMFELTEKEYYETIDNSPYLYTGNLTKAIKSFTWIFSVRFCNKMSLKYGRTPCYEINGENVTCDFSVNGFRLPTEAEWEYAAKGGALSNDFRYSGSNSIDDVAWSSATGAGYVKDVGIKSSNELGIFDMSGNVSEWCWDWYDANYYSSSPKNDPKGPLLGEKRVFRGGNWGAGSSSCTNTARAGINPNFKVLTLGYSYASGLRVCFTAQ